MFEINSISYEKLHTEVYKLIPENFVEAWRNRISDGRESERNIVPIMIV